MGRIIEFEFTTNQKTSLKKSDKHCHFKVLFFLCLKLNHVQVDKYKIQYHLIIKIFDFNKILSIKKNWHFYLF